MNVPNERRPHEMTQTDWLVAYIAKAFDGVTLEDGMDIHAAQSLDDYGNPQEDLLSLQAERLDWRRVKLDTLLPRFWAITCLDAKGFRFYLPAIMTELLKHGDELGNLSCWLLHALVVSEDGLIKDVPFNELFSDRQRAAIIR